MTLMEMELPKWYAKTADGSVDGIGQVIGDAQRDWRILDETSKSFGPVIHGPEHLSVFRGSDGKALQTVDYVPSWDPIDGWVGIGGNRNNDPSCHLLTP